MRQIQLHDTGAVIQLLDSEEGFSDLFQVVRSKDGEVVATVELTYHDDDNNPSAHMVDFESDLVACLPFVIGNEHFISCVTYSILAAFAEEHTFYTDAFQDEEGNGKAIPLYALGF